jgi:DNA-binding GntR family transcriptional regulator
MPGALKVEKLSLAGSLTEAVVDTIRDMVRDGRLVPGTLYSVYQVSEALGVSRSPVREGLLKLA